MVEFLPGNPIKIEDENGYIEEAAIKVYDDAEIVFINRDNYKGIFKPGYGKPVQNINIVTEDTGLQTVDHIVGNVRTNEMNLWENYLNKTLNFETFIEFGARRYFNTIFCTYFQKLLDLRKVAAIKNPINEPYEGLKKSQIEEYIDEYFGSGIQHVAITTNDIIKTIEALRENGMEFLIRSQMLIMIHLKERGFEVTEDIDELKKYGILCDIEGKGYLLQLFTKPIGDRPTFFYEIIQR